MKSDFGDKVKQIKESDPSLSNLSLSQALYYIISKISDEGKYEIKKDK